MKVKVNSPQIEGTIKSYVDEPVDSEHVARMWKGTQNSPESESESGHVSRHGGPHAA